MKTLQTTIQFCALTFALSLSAMEHKPLDPKVQELIDRIDTINVKEISELQNCNVAKIELIVFWQTYI